MERRESHLEITRNVILKRFDVKVKMNSRGKCKTCIMWNREGILHQFIWGKFFLFGKNEVCFLWWSERERERKGSDRVRELVIISHWIKDTYTTIFFFFFPSHSRPLDSKVSNFKAEEKYQVNQVALGYWISKRKVSFPFLAFNEKNEKEKLSQEVQ